ncbi:MAG: hypothetical protein JWN61_311, partial [Pseudonocardiales bacterium]|nr:hypothetical protein [Pseudonocardiales bacterium]
QRRERICGGRQVRYGRHLRDVSRHRAGTVNFAYYGPDDADCSKPAVFASTSPVSPSGESVSAAFAPSGVGTYRAVASYSGDALNAPAAGLCNDANESAIVSSLPTPTIVIELPVPPVPAGPTTVEVAVLASTGASPLATAGIGVGILGFGAVMLIGACRRDARR